MSKWWKEAIGYQVYPRSFKDSNNDGLGDLNGIREKLSYLKDLGVDFVWITPVYESPNVDNGYDISNYCAISEDFGTMADFKQLVAEAKELGIKIIMDLVINHTSDQHEWFQKSRANDPEYRDFYIWQQAVDGQAPNDWQAIFGGPVWEYDDLRGEYYFHSFAKEQPDLNWDSPAMRQKIFAMIEWWIEQGIDGFRIDAISHIKKDVWDRPFDPSDVNGNYKNIAGIDVYLKELSAVLKKHQVMSVGEANGVTAAEATTWVGDEGYFDMIFEFEHIKLWRKKNNEGVDIIPELKAALVRWQEALADGKGWNALYMENHDVPRSISAFGSDAPAYRVLSGKALAMMYLLLQGTPFIYQGQEIGMINNHFTAIEQIDAVDSRNLYAQLRTNGLSAEEAMTIISSSTRDNARTPMQWDATTYAGFSEQMPWLAVNPNKDWLNAAAEAANPDSIFHFYKQLIVLRKQQPVFIDGAFHYIEAETDAVFCYERKDADTCFTVVVNLGAQEAACAYLQELKDQELVLANYQTSAAVLRPYEARLYKK